MTSKFAVDVARGSGYQIARNLANTLVSIAAFAVIARLISREEMGEVAVLNLLVAGTTLIASVGISSTATKYVASLGAEREHNKMNSTAYGCIVIGGIATSIVAFATYVSAEIFASLFFGDSSRAFLLRLLILEVVGVSLQTPLMGILFGLKRFRELSIITMVAFAVRQSLAVVFLTFGWSLPGLVVGWGIGDLLSSLVLLAYTRKLLGPPKLNFDFPSLLRFSFPLLLGDVANYAWTWFDRFLLIPLVTLSQLGAYNVAVTAFGILNSMPGAISGTLFPYYAHLYPTEAVRSGTEDLENAVRKASRYVFLFAIPLSVGLAATAFPAATLLAGSAYVDSAYPLIILSVSLAIGCSITALSQIFVVMERTKTSGAITCISTLASVLLGIVIVPYLGILGASIARAASLIISLAASILILKKILKLSFDTEAYRSAWVASLVMAAAITLIQMIFYSKYLLTLYVAVGGSIFILMLRLLHATNHEDLELVSDFLGPKLGFLTELMKKVLLPVSEVPKAQVK